MKILGHNTSTRAILNSICKKNHWWQNLCKPDI